MRTSACTETMKRASISREALFYEMIGCWALVKCDVRLLACKFLSSLVSHVIGFMYM